MRGTTRSGCLRGCSDGYQAVQTDIAGPARRIVAGVAEARRDVLAVHDADTLVIEKSTPAVCGRKLMKAL